jgi:hypothetical protein
MSASQQNREDVPFILFLVPFAASGIYAIYLWVQAGLSSTLPTTVFLQVTENPYVFLIGFAAVILGVMLDVTFTEPSQRRTKLFQESTTIQVIAFVALVLGFLSAWYAAGGDLGGAATNVLEGRYVVIFPALLVLFSFLILPSVTVRRDQLTNVAVVVLLLAVPVTIDEVGKRSFFAGMGLGFVMLGVAVYLYLAKPLQAKKQA